MYGQRFNCPGRCVDLCMCSGYDDFGNLIRLEARIDEVEAIAEGDILRAVIDEEIADGGFFF